MAIAWAGQKETEEEELVRTAGAEVPDQYITAVPVYVADSTPVKEFNSGSVCASSPVFGLHRVRVRGGQGEGGGGGAGPEWDLSIGDSVAYQRENGMGHGRVIGLAVGEEAGGVVVRIRRYVTAAEAERTAGRGFVTAAVGRQRGWWETEWVEMVPLRLVKRLIKAMFRKGADVGARGGSPEYLEVVGTVTENGEWVTPYVRALEASDEPWVAIKGERSAPTARLLEAASRGQPVVNVSICMWADGFQTFKRGQVSS